MTVARLASILTLLICTSGCAIQFQQLQPSTKIKSTDAVIVLAVSPDSRLSLFDGEAAAGSWSCKSLMNVANVWSKDGFIVLKLPPRTASKNYAVGQILPGGIGGDAFVVREGTAVPVFHAEPGKVSFVGGIRLATTGSGSSRRYGIVPDDSVTREAAQAFVSKVYPKLPEVKTGSLKMLPSSGGC